MDIKRIELQTFDLKQRNIFITTDIDDVSASDIVKKLSEIISSDEDIVNENNITLKKLYNNIKIPSNIEFPEVNLYLDTPGGWCYSGFAIYDMIQKLNKHCKVNIIVTGKCMSMGIPILLAVPYEQRKCTKYTTFMIHQPSGFAMGKVNSEEEQVKETKRISDIMYNIIADETEITKKELQENYTKKEDWFFTAEEALRLKLVSEII